MIRSDLGSLILISYIPMARTNEIEMPPKHTEKVRYQQYLVGGLWRRTVRQVLSQAILNLSPAVLN